MVNKKAYFEKLLLRTERLGIDSLISYLRTKTDFYTTPASTRFHGSCEGGLLHHSLDVYGHMQTLIYAYADNDILQDDIKSDSVILCSLLHDICYVVKDHFPIGHGEKSVILLQRFIELHDDEIMAIRWHMGGFDEAARGGFAASNAMASAMEQCNLAVLLHMADLAATYFGEA